MVGQKDDLWIFHDQMINPVAQLKCQVNFLWAFPQVFEESDQTTGLKDIMILDV